MAKFYFTYGTDGFPYYGGWTEIEAPNVYAATSAFRAYHPDRYVGLLNCSDYYTEREFEKTGMNGPEGNFGNHCHERITITRTIMESEDLK